MSFFKRVYNLVRGTWVVRNSTGPLTEAELDAELARTSTPSRPTAAVETASSDMEPTPAAQGPERDARGNVKKTL